MTEMFHGGSDIAMNVPPHQFGATVAFHRDVVGLQPDLGLAPQDTRKGPVDDWHCWCGARGHHLPDGRRVER
jgi:hypothetical protein